MNNRGITFVIVMLWIALVAVNCEENEPCSVYDELRCADDCLEHCIDGKWEVMIDCKASIGDDAVCIDRAHEEATCTIIGG